MSELLKDLKKEIQRIETAIEYARIEVDAACESLTEKDAEIERLSAKVDELQEKCDYLEEGKS